MDVLNPSRAAKPGGPAPAPADIFAPLAPMPIPTNLFVPSSGVCHVQDGIITCIHQQHLVVVEDFLLLKIELIPCLFVSLD